MTAAMKLDGENAGGEIEIEKIPTSMIEARTKNLVPVFDYLVNSKSQPSRYSIHVHVHLMAYGTFGFQDIRY